MRRTIVTLALLVMALPLLTAAKPADTPANGPGDGGANELPKITGGGWADNDNTLGTPEVSPDLATQFGFTAHATSEGDAGTHGIFETPVTIYDARGQFQARNIDEMTGQTEDKGHGEVVCIANFGPSASVDGGGDPDGDVWEIRVRFEHPDLGDVYGSFLVQDNGKSDYLDENFDGGRITSEECGDTVLFDLEEVEHGQIKVH